jgi:hydrogenase expression/formation protein HypE
MNDWITLGHGSGGRLTGELIGSLFVKRFGMSGPLTDSAIFNSGGNSFAFTTDSFVIDPIFFPGGDIGKLAICGTVNDLAVAGAIPKYISVSMIIEEGFLIADLKTIAGSMAVEAEKAGVRIITGDTKVVEKGKCDKIFITTSGVGIVDPRYIHTGDGSRIRPGNRLIVSGNLGDHSIAVLGARKQISFATRVMSDCASLNHLTGALMAAGIDIKFMRDLTRGGLATVCNEVAKITGMGIILYEDQIPADQSVLGICETLGFDVLYLANEGKLLLVVDEEECQEALEILRQHPLGRRSQIVGEMIEQPNSRVVLRTIAGGNRILGLLSGIQLPRIC